MKRRSFFKGLFGAYAAISGYFSVKYFSEKDNQSNDNINKYINSKTNLKKRGLGVIVEIPIVYHCNLNCAGCDHFASIAPSYIMPVEVFKKDVEHLSKIMNKNLKEMWILGGEPLLHNNLPEIFKIARRCFPKTKIEMLTNGLLLDKQPDSFWMACKKEGIKIVVENYIYNKKDKVNFDAITKKLKQFRCNLSIDGPKYNFRRMNLTKNCVHDFKKRYNDCQTKLWPILDNGKFYSCSVINGVDKFFNKEFPSHAIPVDKGDVLDIYKIKSIDELIAFYEKPKAFCAHCNYFISEGKKWAPSKKELSEWYKV